ncbi:MAG: hypothetical protein HOQ45_14545 [Nocardioidaceae bacterium]|nr:hypothetical protein [Nocardioidaceae bacterium]
MVPLRYVAMGLVVVFLRADFGGYDALADPLGWALVLGALWRLRGSLPGTDVLLWLAAVACVVSAATYLPVVSDGLSPSGEWAVSLPQLGFCIALCGPLAGVARATGTDRGSSRARWLELLRWLFVGLAAGPVLILGGGVDALTTPVAVLAVVANVALVYLTFAVSVVRTADPAESG